MKIIYHCYGGAHSSVIAAHLHLGNVQNTSPSVKDICNLPRFDKTADTAAGQLFFMGRDENGDEVYILGLGSNTRIGVQLIKSLLRYYRIPDHEVLLVFTLPATRMFSRLGGFISRVLKLAPVGRPLVAWDVKRCWNDYVTLVREAKSQKGERQ
ncbi:MAG: DUF3189 family protein [Bacillota bacterium]